MFALSWRILWRSSHSVILKLPSRRTSTFLPVPHHYKKLQRCHSTQAEQEHQVSVSYPGRKFKSFPFAYHTELDIHVDDITNLGMGVGRTTLENGDRWVIMVPNVLPGEMVKVRIYRNHDSYSEADLISIINASSDRVEPLCPYFQSCGGCQYQHMNITAQRKWKKNQVINLLQRIGRIDVKNETTPSSSSSSTLTVNDVVGSDHLFHYRSKMTPHFSSPNSAKPMKIGFQRKNSNVIVDIDNCLIASKAINEKYTEAKRDLLRNIQTLKFKRGATLLFREADDQYVSTNPKETVTQTVNSIKFQFKAGEFFQNNPHVLSMMVDHVLNQACKGDTKCNYLVDAYCGSGLFSLCAAHRFQSVYGVEVSQLAVEAAIRNAKINNIENAHFLCSSSEGIFEKIRNIPGNEAVVIIDPPRKGCDSVFLNQLFEFKPKRIVYVSCDPATQARDTKYIVENGYQIDDITPFDLFPQTRHIENVITYKLCG